MSFVSNRRAHIAELRDRIRPRFATASAIQGNLLVGGLIVSATVHGDPSNIMVAVVSTIFVFWVAHVYAGAVAGHGVKQGVEVSVGQAIRGSLAHSLGMVFSALIPTALLVLGVLDLIPDLVAIQLALWSGVVILFVLGYAAFTARGSSIGTRILGGLTTAALGALMVVLKALLH